MKQTLFIFTATSFIFSTQVFSAEADHYTYANSPLEDAADIVNKTANMYLNRALEKLNSESRCDLSVKAKEEALYKELQKYFANHNHGQLVKDILTGEPFPTRVIPKTESIYGQWQARDGFLLGRKGAEKSQLGLMPLMKIGSINIGVDKLEHMFGMGFHYYKSHYLKQQALYKVLNGGVFREKTTLGGNPIATGVFSYGDLSANFNGMRFWNHILQKHDDILGAAYNRGPYVQCENGSWKTTEKVIDFKYYVDESMDESINCRKLATKGGFEQSKQEMINRGLDPNACPANTELLQQMLTKYNLKIMDDPKGRSISNWIINQNGLGMVKYFGEIKE